MFWGIILATFLEISVYLSRVFVHKDLVKRAPSVYDLITPLKPGQYITLEDGKKTFYADRYKEFASLLSPVLDQNSSFVKTAEASYSVAGDVTDIKTIESELVKDFFGYKFTLKNRQGEQYTVDISPEEALYANIYSTVINPYNLEKTKTEIKNIKIGDYVVINKSINLLNSTDSKLDIEVLSPTSGK